MNFGYPLVWWWLLWFVLVIVMQQQRIDGGVIIAPAWADPEWNPCASMPGGWQLLYWPPLKKCFKIFTVGYPCPETMELSPAAVFGSGKRMAAGSQGPLAECRCPPGTALSLSHNKCYKLFERLPCDKGQYFHPTNKLPTNYGNNNISKSKFNNRLGVCKILPLCPDDLIYWPKDGKCYRHLMKGPCARNKLLIRNQDGLGECRCENIGEMKPYYYDVDDTCHEHFTRGPCSTPGHLFLPDGECNCHPELPHYYAPLNKCYELNTQGPCAAGSIYQIMDNLTDSSNLGGQQLAQCQCKEGYIPWLDGKCYRLYTQGPCQRGQFLLNATSCVENFCGRHRLYFPEQQQCYRIGTQGPCASQQVVVFDFTVKPSVDGISYHGVCGCSGLLTNLDQNCSPPPDDESETKANFCKSTPGLIDWQGNCYKLYSRGPCGPGQWLEPIKSRHLPETAHTPKQQVRAKCVCRPGYTPAAITSNASDTNNLKLMVVKGLQRCNAPTVTLARYLQQQQQQKQQLLQSKLTN